jgi:Zn-dependent peptidase ImmA (M78 family)
MNQDQFEKRDRGTLVALRALIRERQMRFDEALRLAELQASRLRELSGAVDGYIPVDVLSAFPRITLRYRRIPTSGLTYWDGHVWVVGVNCDEPESRQRFTAFHELKHILDHGRTTRLYTAAHPHDAARQAERAADYFAGCVLMPKRSLTSAWCGGTQRVADLAAMFEVSERAIEVRLSQLGLTERAPRHAHDQFRTEGPRRSDRYERALSDNWQPVPMEAAA